MSGLPKKHTRSNGSKAELVSEFRRGQIIDAARTVFARRGFEAGIIDEIAREAKIAKGTVYLYFRSKSEIYKAVFDRDMKELKQSTIDRIQAAGTLRHKIEAFILARLENAEARKDFFRIMDADQGHLSISRGQYRSWLREPVLHLADAIEHGIQGGEIRSVAAEKAAWAIADMTRGVIQRRLLGHNAGSLAEEAAFLSTFAWAALVRPPE